MPRTTAAEDKRDIERVLAGDLEAFQGIVKRWQGPLVNLAFRFCRDEGRAEEFAQDAFVRVFRSLHQWRQEAAFSTWLFALAVNVFRSHMRQASGIEVSTEDVRGVASTPSPESAAIARDTADTVRRMVSTLPPKYRDALILFYFLDQDVAQAADCLGVPAGTVKARLHRGRELLRDRLIRVLRLAPEDTP
jgi:RNA polymerase sigma-70 factor (ECF subfamily)